MNSSMMQRSATMQRLFALAGIIFLCLAVSACEEVVEADLPFVERLVVQGTLVAGQPADSIFIKRTVPLSARYDSARAILSDASGRIEGGGKSYPLVHVGESRYEATGLVPESGVRYRLVADWHGKSVQASTTIPYLPQVDTIITKKSTEDHPNPNDAYYASIEAHVRPRPTETYAMEVYDRNDSRFDFYPVVDLNYNDVIGKPDDTLANGRVQLLFDDYSFVLNRNRARVVVYSYDLSFYDFYYSYYDRDGDGGAIFNTPQPVRWNVEGDGIGIFIGRAAVSLKLP